MDFVNKSDVKDRTLTNVLTESIGKDLTVHDGFRRHVRIHITNYTLKVIEIIIITIIFHRLSVFLEAILIGRQQN